MLISSFLFFYFCNLLERGNLKYFDTSNIKYMGDMFNGCK